jgi:hypothetical protein
MKGVAGQPYASTFGRPGYTGSVPALSVRGTPVREARPRTLCGPGNPLTLRVTWNTLRA